jgi:hypothetical protein
MDGFTTEEDCVPHGFGQTALSARRTVKCGLIQEKVFGKIRNAEAHCTRAVHRDITVVKDT